MIGKKLWLLFSVSLLSLALLFVSVKPELDHLVGAQALYGHQTLFDVPHIAFEDQNQERVNWSDLTEQPLYLSTGFTHCQHACPVTMAQFRLMQEEFGNQANFIFITLDPERDTSERMHEYLASFSSSFIGARTESKSDLKEFMASLKQSYNLGEGNQTINHQNTIYLIHPNAPGFIIYTRNRMDVYKMKEDLALLNHS